MQLNILKSISAKTKNVIYLSDTLTELKESLSTEEISYFKKFWEKDNFQYIKGVDGYTFVVKTKKKNLESIRKQAYAIHKIVKFHHNELVLSGDNKDQLLAFAEAFTLSNYQFLKYFTEKDSKKPYALKQLKIHGPVTKKELDEISNLTKAVFWARDMVNEPVSFMDATQLAKEIKDKGKEADIQVDVLRKGKIETLKMGGLLAVNQGSEQPPTFSIMEYKPKNAKNKKPIVLVGKGVVYDTGGLSLKPTQYMDTMKSDMGGAAAMSATIYALALNKVPVHVIGLIPATDNRPAKTAYAPGDVVKMYDGTTVEVLNTDAEGRMILADALAYANKYKPELVIDAATLTGAAVRALGTKTSISMGNAKDKYFKKLYEVGQQTHDRVFRFPFWDEWKKELKSDIADLKNLGSMNAGMITAGKFLEHFTKFPYIHLDIAGPAFLDKPDAYNGKGATGAGVRLLYHFLKEL